MDVCEAAQIIQEAPAIPNNPNGSAPTRAKAKPRDKGQQSTKQRQQQPPPPPPPPPRDESADGLPDLVAVLVKQLPRKGESMTPEDAEWWFDMAKLAFPRAYNFDPLKREDR
jgi:hypothetical protein